MRDTLLVIDDSPLDLAILREIFRPLFRVECFEEASPAIACIHRAPQRICAILLDICLGRRGAGFQVLQQLQSEQETAGLPVILITSDPSEEQVLHAVSRGAVDFLVKPVDPLAVQERVCTVVRDTWPAGSTALDAPVRDILNAQGPLADAAQDSEERLLELFFQARPGFSLAYYHLLGRITEALAEGLRRVSPSCGLSREDPRQIGRAAVFCDVGLLGVPDNVIEQGAEQSGAGQELYFRHTALGHALFTSGPFAALPIARTAADIAYWHHKNYDGSGYPKEETAVPVPLSAQLVHAAIRCMEYRKYFQGYPDRLDRTLRAMATDVGRYISAELYQAALAARDSLADCMAEDLSE